MLGPNITGQTWLVGSGIDPLGVFSLNVTTPDIQIAFNAPGGETTGTFGFNASNSNAYYIDNAVPKVNSVMAYALIKA